jgi:hypothetical protein
VAELPVGHGEPDRSMIGVFRVIADGTGLAAAAVGR